MRRTMINISGDITGEVGNGLSRFCSSRVSQWIENVVWLMVFDDVCEQLRYEMYFNDHRVVDA